MLRNTYLYEILIFTSRVRCNIILRSKGESLRGGDKIVGAN